MVLIVLSKQYCVCETSLTGITNSFVVHFFLCKSKRNVRLENLPQECVSLKRHLQYCSLVRELKTVEVIILLSS